MISSLVPEGSRPEQGHRLEAEPPTTEGAERMPSEIIYSVFVSSTYDDLREERAEVQKALLKLRCMPIGMELFGAADEETWEFIKRQITECDYYVVVIADRYGSLAADGLSYTEKEYDYAREIHKPVLAFIHGNRGSIPRDKTESDADKRRKLDAFIQKVEGFPVDFFASPHELATQVTVSFVNLRDRRPAVGFIRADQAPDLEKYNELLKENARLRSDVSRFASGGMMPFPRARESATVTLWTGTRQPGRISFGPNERQIQASLTWGEIFICFAEQILNNSQLEFREALAQLAFREALAKKTIGQNFEGEYIRVTFHEELDLAERLQLWGLLHHERGIWTLTDYGRKQYGFLVP
jgi:hypothetical protein